MINEEIISKFLEGRNPKRYIVNIEANYNSDYAHLIYNEPDKEKRISKEKFKTFLWFNDEVPKLLFNGNRRIINQHFKKNKITIKKLKTKKGDESIDRMENGYKYLAKCEGSYRKLLKVFKDGGLDPNSEEHRDKFEKCSPIEQFMISTGKRLFKGMEEYDDLHRAQFDIETTGLNAIGRHISNKDVKLIKDKMKYNRENGIIEDLTRYYIFDDNNEPIRFKDDSIFQLGYKDNKGNEYIIDVPIGQTKKETLNNEKVAIIKFFKLIDMLKPDLIAGYNSEFFDFPFILSRCEVLGLDPNIIIKTLDPSGKQKLRRLDRTLKLGSEVEDYQQTVIWGYNIVDTSHAVRRAKAINSEIKKWGLKYITEFSGLNKKNRVYVKGDQIYNIWADTDTDYAFNNENGEYYIITDETPLKENFEVVKGKYIIERYLLDDLWETEKVDEAYNQASFLLSKLIPTSYGRSTTMGTAGIWKLIMMAWSYENNLAIPKKIPKPSFTGGLSRLVEVGYADDVAKLDYAALYPNIEITHDIFPSLDITGVMKGMLIYIASTRDKYKALKNEHGAIASELKGKLKSGDFENEEELKRDIEKHSSLKSLYDKKQLPIKILGNSFFGSLGAQNIFNWGDTDSAEETTCRGRQYLRLMVHFFHERYGFRPLVGDTDGFNFAIPEHINEIKYTPLGTHRFTEPTKGKELIGLEAVVAEFNELYMIGRMGLDIDDICSSTINFSRKNYANLINGKIKLVGNTIKSSKLATYIEEFLSKGIEYLLDNDGHSFISLYQETVKDIYNYRIPLSKIASKANVKQTIHEYELDCQKLTKAGTFKSRKAHMELLIANNEPARLGEMIYYVNTGSAKSHGDCKVIKNKETGERTVQLQCKLISSKDIENNPNITTDEYNVARYLAAFNKRIEPILVCFDKNIRDMIMINTIKNKKTQELDLTEIHQFSKDECKLVANQPYNESDQDDLDNDLMMMEDKEFDFWIRTGKIPNNLSDLEMNWEELKSWYREKKKAEEIALSKREYEQFVLCLKSMELIDYEFIKEKLSLPKCMSDICVLKRNEEGDKLIVYNKRNKKEFTDVKGLFKFKKWAEDRYEYYENEPNIKKHTYESWLISKWEKFMTNKDYKSAMRINEELKLIGSEQDSDEYIKNKKVD